MFGQRSHSSALLSPVRRVQFGVFSAEDIVRSRVGAKTMLRGESLGSQWGHPHARPWHAVTLARV